jgi:cell division protein FtsB
LKQLTKENEELKTKMKDFQQDMPIDEETQQETNRLVSYFFITLVVIVF